MKKSLTYLATASLLSVTLITVGCGETESVTSTTQATGPGGTTEVTKETKVETTGEAPPVVAPTESTTPATP